MSLTDDDVRYVAKLGALQLSDAEVTKFRNDLNEILSYVEKLSEVSSRGVVATSHVHGAVNAFRDDIIRDSFSAEKALANAPEKHGGSFRVPRIVS